MLITNMKGSIHLSLYCPCCLQKVSFYITTLSRKPSSPKWISGINKFILPLRNHGEQVQENWGKKPGNQSHCLAREKHALMGDNSEEQFCQIMGLREVTWGLRKFPPAKGELKAHWGVRTHFELCVWLWISQLSSLSLWWHLDNWVDSWLSPGLLQW